MPNEKYILEADVSEMVSAQKAMITQQSQLLKEMKKGTNATKQLGKAQQGMASKAVSDLKSIVMQWGTVGAAIGAVRKAIQLANEDMDAAKTSAVGLAGALGALAVTKPEWLSAAKTYAGQAVRRGVPGPQTVSAYTRLASEIGDRKKLEDVMGEGTEIFETLRTEMSLTEIVSGLANFQRGAGGSAQRAQNALLFSQEEAKGSFADMGKYGGKATAMLTGVGVSPEKALALFATATKAGGAEPATAVTGLKSMWRILTAQDAPAFRQLGISGVKPGEALEALQKARASGELTDQMASQLFGGDAYITGLHMLGAGSEIERRTLKARAYLAPNVDRGKIAMREHLKDESQRRITERNIASASADFSRAIGPMGPKVVVGETMDILSKAEARELGEGSLIMGWLERQFGLTNAAVRARGQRAARQRAWRTGEPLFDLGEAFDLEPINATDGVRGPTPDEVPNRINVSAENPER